MKKLKEYISFLKTIFIALILAGLVRSFWFEPFHIPSGSMKPGLLVGDYIIVSKYSYGYSRYSFPFGFNFFEGRIFAKEPQRGQVVVFRYPPDPSINYVKRLIGLPGDSIQMRDGFLYINDKKIEKIADGKFFDEQITEIPVNIKKFIEILPDGKKIETLDMQENSISDDTGIYKVPQGYYFMMGDNRDNSQDSRFLSYVGFVPQENLIGEARFIFFSTQDPLWQILKLHNSIRFERIFKKIN
ncbi:MAG TPA: signal peptidase I [Rickettsiales bacterium]|nr:signal peptidase I [Rickettsiales bacterium]